MIGLARPHDGRPRPPRGRDGPAGHRRLGLDEGDGRRADPARCGPRGRGRLVRRRSCPRASASGSCRSPSQPVTLVEPTTDRAELDRAIDSLEPRDGTAMGDALMQVLDIAESIQAEAGTGSTGTPAPAPSTDPNAAPDPLRVAGTVSERGARRRAVRRATRRRRSCCPTAPTRSVRPSRSMRPSAPPRWACRSTPSPSGRPEGRVTVRTSNGQLGHPRCPAGHRDPRADRRDHRGDGVRRATAEDLERGLRQPAVARRLHRGDPGGHVRVRGRGPGARRGRQRGCRRCGSAGCRRRSVVPPPRPAAGRTLGPVCHSAASPFRDGMQPICMRIRNEVRATDRAYERGARARPRRSGRRKSRGAGLR